MTHAHSGKPGCDGELDAEVVVIGGGITGIYQLYRLREAGYSAVLLEAGGGVGGTWYWNRYPAARFDSESYSYGYFFSDEILAGWRWKEHFAGQSETEAYLNYVVDHFDLREFMRFDSFVAGADWDDETARWTIRLRGGATLRAKFVIAATGILSVPFIPDIAGRANFQGEAYHPGQWPDGVDFTGKRVAVVGNGSSGVQIIPAVVDHVASLTLYQRTANWCVPLNNTCISDSQWSEIAASFDQIYARTQATSMGFLHSNREERTFDVPEEERLRHYEEVWRRRGHSAFFGNFTDTLTDPAANADFSRFLAGKIRAIVHDPETAERLIPKDHGFGMKRPPLVNGYYEAFNSPHVELVDLREDPIAEVVRNGIRTRTRTRTHDMIVWATGFDAVTGALTRMDIVGRGGLILRDAWADGPRTLLGIQSVDFPNFFFVGGPHSTAGNIPRSTEFHVDFVTRLLIYVREHGFDTVAVEEDAVEKWTAHVYEGAAGALVAASNWLYGTNIPGKAPRPLMYRSGLPVYREKAREIEVGDYAGFQFSSNAR